MESKLKICVGCGRNRRWECHQYWGSVGGSQGGSYWSRSGKIYLRNHILIIHCIHVFYLINLYRLWTMTVTLLKFSQKILKSSKISSRTMTSLFQMPLIRPHVSIFKFCEISNVSRYSAFKMWLVRCFLALWQLWENYCSEKW